MTKTTKSEQRAGEIYDLLVNAPDGLTINEITDLCGWPVPITRLAIRQLRLTLGNSGDTINVPCIPQGKGEQWKYMLAVGLEAHREWTTNRLGDMESRLETIEAIATSIEKAEDGRSVEGRKAKKIHRTIEYLRKELLEIV